MVKTSLDSTRESKENLADSQNSAGNENLFRVPFLPTHAIKKKAQKKSPLRTDNSSNAQANTTEEKIYDKKSAMLKKLERRRAANMSKWDKQKQASSEAEPVLDLGQTEKSFLEQSFVPPPPRLSFSNISMIAPSDTFMVKTPKKKAHGPGFVCSTPFRLVNETAEPSPPLLETTKSVDVLFENQPIYESHEDIAERQFKALAIWCNTLLNTCNRFDDGVVDLGKTKNEATKKLQELLSKPGKNVESPERPSKFSYKEFLRKQGFDIIKAKAYEVYSANDMPQLIVNMIQMGVVTIRDGSNVYSDIMLKTVLLRVFLSFNPVWLHLGMETVFGKTINIPDGSSFLSTMTRFINTYLFSDPEIMKKRKYAIGTVKMLVTPEGRGALHRHFLTKACQFFYCVEKAKMVGVIPGDPRLFVRKGQFKCLNDVFSELSREVLSASGTPLNKALIKLGFTPSYKQNYFDDLEYKIDNISDLNDGVNLGKLVEVACNLGRGTVMGKLRNPGGDRLRKIGNVSVVLDFASKSGVDVGKIKPEAIVGGNKEAVLEVLWKIIGVFVLSSDNKYLALNKEVRRRSLLNDSREEFPEKSGEAPNFEQFVLGLCQSLGISYGMTITVFEDLKDGTFLSMIWRDYNKKAVDIHFYEGKDLFRKVVNAAVSELDIPHGLHFSLPLFVHQFLTKLFEISRLNEAASRIQRAYRSYRFLKALKIYLRSDEYKNSKQTAAASPVKGQITLVSYSSTPTFSSSNAEEADNLKENEEKEVEGTFVVIGNSQLVKEIKLEEPSDVENQDTVDHADSAFSFFIEKSVPTGQMDQTYVFVNNSNEDSRLQTDETVTTVFSDICNKDEERTIPNDDQNEESSAKVIQKHWRGYSARKRYHMHKRDKLLKLIQTSSHRSSSSLRGSAKNTDKKKKEGQMVVKLQSFIRRSFARRKYEKLVEDKEETIKNVILIQSAARRFLAKKKYNQMLKNKEELLKNVVSIQSLIRRNIAQKKVRELKEAKKAYERKIIIIQSAVRRFLAQKRLQHLLKEKDAQKERENKAALVIQRFYRTYLAARRINEEARELAQKEKENNAVFVIQDSLRYQFLLKKCIKMAKDFGLQKEGEYMKKVITAQRAIRRFLFQKRQQRLFVEKTAQKEKEDHAAWVIQKFFRYYLTARKFCEIAKELSLQKEHERKIIIVQSVIRRFLANKQFEKLKTEKFEQEKFEKMIISLQSIGRGFLVRSRVNQVVQDKVEALELSLNEAFAQTPSTPKTPSYVDRIKPRLMEKTPSTPELLRRLRRIQLDINTLKASNAACEATLDSLRLITLKDSDAEVGPNRGNIENEYNRDESTPEKIVVKQYNHAELEKAAMKIQSWWRGYCIRKQQKCNIQQRRSAMLTRREIIEKLDYSFDAKRPAYTRLQELPDMLFNSSLYKNKVAAVAIDRIIKLSSHLCHYFVVQCDGLSAVLDRMEQSDRSAGEAEIILYLTSVLSHLIQTAISQSDIKTNVLNYNQDILKILFHEMNAFYNNSEIVKAAVAGIVTIKKLDNNISYEKSRFYISQAEKRYNRLPAADSKKIALNELKKYYI